MKYLTMVNLRKLTAEQLADIALKLGAKHPADFDKEVALVFPSEPEKFTFIVPFTQERVVFTTKELIEIKAFCASRMMVGAIKRVREIAGIGLKEAKDLVEAEWYTR